MGTQRDPATGARYYLLFTHSLNRAKISLFYKQAPPSRNPTFSDDPKMRRTYAQ